MRKVSHLFSILMIVGLILPAVVYAKKPVVSGTTAQTISGSIVDKETGENLGGVYLYFEELGKGVYSEPDGKFNIEGIQPGNYQVTLKFISYNDKQVTVKVKKTNKNKKIIEMEPVLP
jgi:hypothetical protein